MPEIEQPTEKRLASGMNFTVYPEERTEVLRIMRERKFRAPFDVVRHALRKSQICKPGQIEEPRKRE